VPAQPQTTANDVESQLRPAKLRLEAAGVCQLRCPSCPTASGTVRQQLGDKLLEPDQLAKLLQENPWVKEVELSNWGEIFLNPHLLQILEVAHQYGVGLTADNGANFNRVSDEVLQGLVRFQFRSINCSIDGATQATYQIYRRRGNLHQVLANLERLNDYKKLHQSQLPKLRWQFIAFEHNLHEIEAARELAAKLNMQFHLKLGWGDLYSPDAFSPVQNLDELRRQHPLGVATRAEYQKKVGEQYLQCICQQLWQQPQVHADGRMLGCCVNTKVNYGNVFKDGLTQVLNGEPLNYARQMLTGQAPARDDIACSNCSIYKKMAASNSFLPLESPKT
jgi:MoaA/NifB/PqqE/SkfB family radical SAM enzyme